MVLERAKKFVKEHLNESLFKNSYFLMGNTFLNASIGFVFWIIASKFYSPVEIGLGSAVVSVFGFISLISILGFDISLIRYIPSEPKKNEMINSCFLITSVLSLSFSFLFLLGLNLWLPSLILLKESLVLGFSFIIFSVFNSLSILQISVFVAYRQAKYSFFQSISNFFRILFLPLLMKFSFFGIYSSFGLSYIANFFFGNFLMNNAEKDYKFSLSSFNSFLIKKMIRYSFDNYILNLIITLPNFLLPLLTINTLGPSYNAYFFIPWTISSILLMIPISNSKSLLAEGSFSEKLLKENIIKSLLFNFVLLALAIILIIFFGKHLLFLFGNDYVENSLYLLLILSLASLPYAIIHIFTTYYRIKNNLRLLFLVHCSISAITLVGSFLFINVVGIMSIGFSWLIANSLIALFIIIFTWRYKWLN